MQVNGSSYTGRCSASSIIMVLGIAHLRCNTPSTSVLFDGNIPTLIGLQGDVWASQLFIMGGPQPVKYISFHFTASDFTRVRRVEVVLFNCPGWGISVQTIQLNTSTPSTVQPMITSCDSLVRVCLSLTQPNTERGLRLDFTPHTGSNWVHIAEVTFRESGFTCLQEFLFTPPPPDTTTPRCLLYTSPSPRDS